MASFDASVDQNVSLSEGAPNVTINHDVTADLDSSNAFEGPEKLLEVWFAPSPASLPSTTAENGLKAISSSVWEGMLDLVNCKVLSVVNSEHVDAYLLSESSMFVFAHKIILKTCGTTTLLLGLRRLLQIAAVEAGFPYHNAQSVEDSQVAATPYRVFYSRKNFLFPDKQRGPHRSWKQEVTFLDDMFAGGSAYMVGKMNGDHWYLYMTSPNSTLTPPRTPEGAKSPTRTRSIKIPTGLTTTCDPGDESVHDETLEVLMTDLNVDLAKQFYLSNASAVAKERVPAQGETEDGLTSEGHVLGTAVSENCGLSNVYPISTYPDARIDAYLFSPCGFSANGVVPAAPSTNEHGNAEHYFTVHVTPEPNCSFASFETNVPGGQKGRDTVEIIEHVVDIFRPGRFSVTLFEAKNSGAKAYNQGDEGQGHVRRQRPEKIPGYRRVDRIVYDFDDYDLVFGFYERNGWVSDGMARVGEDIE